MMQDRFGGLGGLGGLTAPLTGEELMAIAAMRGPSMRAYEPTLGDRIGYAIYDAVGGLGGLGGIQNRMREEGSAVADFVPGAGDAIATDQALRNWTAGDYLGAAIEASTVFPGVGDIAGKVGKGLRQRYSSSLNDAVDWSKDIDRIKLTPKRVEKAKESLAKKIETWHQARSPGYFPETDQMAQAKDFARQMVREGEEVRFRMPDGHGGSLYVRVGDKGTVRFSDHPQPRDHDGTVTGGFSKTLGRRHHPAQYSVSPTEMDVSDVLALLGIGAE